MTRDQRTKPRVSIGHIGYAKPFAGYEPGEKGKQEIDLPYSIIHLQSNDKNPTWFHGTCYIRRESRGLS